MFSRKLRSWKTKFESQNCCNCRSLKPSISLCMTVVLLICCCHDNRHKMPLSSCGEGGLKDQTGGEYMGEGLWACFLEKNLCHYKVATGLWFTAAYSPYSSTGPWSPLQTECRATPWLGCNLYPLSSSSTTLTHSPAHIIQPTKKSSSTRLEASVPRRMWLFCCWWAPMNKQRLRSIYDCMYSSCNARTVCETKQRLWDGFLDWNWREVPITKIWNRQTEREQLTGRNRLPCSCNELLKSIP